MNTQVGDSASTASAIYSGVKTKYGEGDCWETTMFLN